MVDVTYIKNLAPEFASETDARINLAIQIANAYINIPFWPAEKVDFAIGLFASHVLSMGRIAAATGGGSGGFLTGERVGDLSKSYAAPTFNSSSALSSTGYGILLMEAMRTLLISPFIASGASSPWMPAPYIPLNWD